MTYHDANYGDCSPRVLAQLDASMQGLVAGRIDEAMGRLCDCLLDERQSLAREDWDRRKLEYRRHPIGALLRQDPFTARAAAKPRGYPGDAELLDYVYAPESWPATTELGASIARYSTNRCAPKGVRWRRDEMARIVDELAAGRPNLRIVAVACGHLREADRSEALKGGGIEAWHALDHDPCTLGSVSGLNTGVVRPLKASVRQLLTGTAPIPAGGADLVYATGLFDYLSDRTAAALLGRLLDIAAPSGRVVVANFAPDLPDTGYMEVFMEWDLTYRNEEEMVALANRCDGQVASLTTYRDSDFGIVFMDISRA